jgi:hypothetical protein
MNKDGEMLPSAMLSILELGIQRFDEPSALTVDAAEVNPRQRKSKAKSRPKKAPAKRKPAKKKALPKR